MFNKTGHIRGVVIYHKRFSMEILLCACKDFICIRLSVTSPSILNNSSKAYGEDEINCTTGVCTYVHM